MMDWRKIRYMRLKKKKGNLVEYCNQSAIAASFLQQKPHIGEIVAVKDIMITNPTTISPDATITEALETIVLAEIGCLR